MTKRAVFLHTMVSLAHLFGDLAKEILAPDAVEVAHLVDELLLKEVLARGELTDDIRRRLAEHAIAAEAFGGDLLMVTCSSIAPAVAEAQRSVRIPVLRLDQPMVDRAIALGTRIGIAATAYTTLGPTTQLLCERSEQIGKRVTAEAMLCKGAYAAMGAGDLATHDRIIRETIEVLSERNDVIVLAQASMARVTASLPERGRVPVLASPRLAVEYIRDMLH